jgi:peptidoglycan/LPS O-acetylase OafA/YrhL
MKLFPNNQGHFPTINFLRAFVAICVVFYHFIHFSDHNGDFISDPSSIKDWSGYFSQTVFIFFIISGFTIPLYLSKIKYKIKNIGGFFTNRILRIGIPYWIAVILFILIEFMFSIKNGTTFQFEFERIIHHFFFSIQFSAYEWYNPIFWTLAVEMQFYFLIAFMYPLLTSNKTWLTYLTIILFSISGLIFSDNSLLFYYAPFFAIGMGLFLLFKEKIKMIPAIIFIVCNLGAIFWVHDLTIFLVSILSIPFFTNIPINNRIFNFIGNNSYSLYLIHGAIGGSIIYLFGRYIENELLKYLLVIVSFIISLAGSYIFFLIIEKPSLRLVKRIQNKGRN